MTTPSERVERHRKYLKTVRWRDAVYYSAIEILEAYDEMRAGAHAIRCTCDGATRDARCGEMQGVAGVSLGSRTSESAEPATPPDPLDGFRSNLQR